MTAGTVLMDFDIWAAIVDLQSISKHTGEHHMSFTAINHSLTLLHTRGDEALRSTSLTFSSTMHRSSVLRWVWLNELRNRFTGERLAPIDAHVVDDFGDLQPVRYLPCVYRDGAGLI